MSLCAQLLEVHVLNQNQMTGNLSWEKTLLEKRLFQDMPVASQNNALVSTLTLIPQAHLDDRQLVP